MRFRNTRSCARCPCTTCTAPPAPHAPQRSSHASQPRAPTRRPHLGALTKPEAGTWAVARRHWALGRCRAWLVRLPFLCVLRLGTPSRDLDSVKCRQAGSAAHTSASHVDGMAPSVRNQVSSSYRQQASFPSYRAALAAPQQHLCRQPCRFPPAGSTESRCRLGPQPRMPDSWLALHRPSGREASVRRTLGIQKRRCIVGARKRIC